MAEAGWEVTFLSAPIDGDELALPRIRASRSTQFGARPSHVMSKVNYALYAAAAARLALRLRPDVVYASDPLGAGPGLLAARLAGATLVYHEHDSPSPGMLHPVLARSRAAAARAARLIVFPNEERARVAQNELRFSDDKLHIVWNVPRRAELVSSAATAEPPLIVYYHGSITPERLPETVALAVRRMAGRVRLRIAGYEAPSARGYVRHLVGSDSGAAADAIRSNISAWCRARICWRRPRARMSACRSCLSTQATSTCSHMTGASNKPFDYMAAGLALLVSRPSRLDADVRRAWLRAGSRSDKRRFPFRGAGMVRESSGTSAEQWPHAPGPRSKWTGIMIRSSRQFSRHCPMLDRQRAFHLARLFVRAVPDMPGKLRFARFALRPFRKLQSVRMPDRFGNTLCCPSVEEPIAVAIFANGVYEPDTVAGILGRIPKDGVYLDVGANIGAIALPVARQRPDVQRHLHRGRSGHGHDLATQRGEQRAPNITVAECLAGPCSEEAVRFYTAPLGNFGMGSIGPQFDRPPVVLRQVALDELLDDMGIGTSML